MADSAYTEDDLGGDIESLVRRSCAELLLSEDAQLSWESLIEPILNKVAMFIQSEIRRREGMNIFPAEITLADDGTAHIFTEITVVGGDVEIISHLQPLRTALAPYLDDQTGSLFPNDYVDIEERLTAAENTIAQIRSEISRRKAHA
jgi:hypothetical protein